MEMLSRVFPFHGRSQVERVLHLCDGDVARTVQQLVGNRNDASDASDARHDNFLPVLNAIGNIINN